MLNQQRKLWAYSPFWILYRWVGSHSLHSGCPWCQDNLLVQSAAQPGQKAYQVCPCLVSPPWPKNQIGPQSGRAPLVCLLWNGPWSVWTKLSSARHQWWSTREGRRGQSTAILKDGVGRGGGFEEQNLTVHPCCSLLGYVQQGIRRKWWSKWLWNCVLISVRCLWCLRGKRKATRVQDFKEFINSDIKISDPRIPKIFYLKGGTK